MSSSTEGKANAGGIPAANGCPGGARGGLLEGARLWPRTARPQRRPCRPRNWWTCRQRLQGRGALGSRRSGYRGAATAAGARLLHRKLAQPAASCPGAQQPRSGGTAVAQQHQGPGASSHFGPDSCPNIGLCTCRQTRTAPWSGAAPRWHRPGLQRPAGGWAQLTGRHRGRRPSGRALA